MKNLIITTTMILAMTAVSCKKEEKQPPEATYTVKCCDGAGVNCTTWFAIPESKINDPKYASCVKTKNN
ncbi:MAG: hypothetical protein IT212_07780 [Bacteroidia bacterium]|nr:hypothetical protein [Bacteroidia bacterium]